MRRWLAGTMFCLMVLGLPVAAGAYSTADLEGSWTVTDSQGEATWNITFSAGGTVTAFSHDKDRVVAFSGQFSVSASGGVRGTMNREQIDGSGLHFWTEDIFSGAMTTATTMSLTQTVAWWGEGGARNYYTYDTLWVKGGQAPNPGPNPPPTQPGPAPDYSKDFTNSIGMVFRLIPAWSWSRPVKWCMRGDRPFAWPVTALAQRRWLARWSPGAASASPGLRRPGV